MLGQVLKSKPLNCVKHVFKGQKPFLWLVEWNQSTEMNFLITYFMFQCLQCFDAVGWVAGRASSL